MINWLKKNGLSVIAVILSGVAVLRPAPFVLSDSSLSWLLGLAITIVSVGIVAILGYQIYNASSLEDRYKKAFDTRIKEAEEKLSISGVRSTTAVLYQAEGINLKLSIGINDYISATKTLSKMAEYAILLNESDRISDVAKLVVNTKFIIDQRGVKSSNLDNFFSVLSQNVLTHLSASDVHAPHLWKIVETTEGAAGSNGKDTSPKEKLKQE